MTVAPIDPSRAALPALLGGLLVAAVWVQAIVSTPAPGVVSLIVYTAVPIGALVVTWSMSLRQRRWIEAAGLMLAITPTLLSSMANSQRHGAVGVLAACGAIWFVRWNDPAGARMATGTRRAVWLGVAGAATALSAIWAVSGRVWESGAPAWSFVTALTGDMVKSAVAGVGEDGSLIPDTAQLGWWCGVGLLVGAAVVAGRVRLAWVVPGAIAALILGCWAIERWRGPVVAVGGGWIASAAIAGVGASVRLDRLQEVRIARAVVVLAGAGWVAGMAQQIKVAAADPALPGGDWEFWHRWQIEAAGVPAVLLLIPAVGVPVAFVGLVWALTIPPRGIPPELTTATTERH